MTMVRTATDGWQPQERVAQFHRLCAVLSNVGQSIVRASGPESLLADVCRILVEDGGLRAAWFEAPEAGSGTLVPVARHGHAEIRAESGGSASYPVTVETRLAGVLNLQEAEPGFFDEQNSKLLSALASILSFALERMEGERQARAQA